MNTSIGEKYVVDENGKATAVILPIESFKKILKILHNADDQSEDHDFYQSHEFKRLVKKGTEDINMGKASPWKDVWNEL
ncbi:hypothetical protein [Desulfonatronovibrio magnus]|uniref:hypothetical protein n=1 Tax=Desulfonatronovibrio magnus TaxID=698827 RepID=UPI0005EB6805|nr:hypothetical protein [Desulfonatronovibrio magnus]